MDHGCLSALTTPTRFKWCLTHSLVPGRASETSTKGPGPWHRDREWTVRHCQGLLFRALRSQHPSTGLWSDRLQNSGDTGNQTRLSPVRDFLATSLLSTCIIIIFLILKFLWKYKFYNVVSFCCTVKAYSEVKLHVYIYLLPLGLLVSITPSHPCVIWGAVSWAPVLHSRLLLVVYLTLGSVCMSILLSQSVPLLPFPTLCLHVCSACLSTPSLERGLICTIPAAPPPQIPLYCY